jgi:ABC-type multidrug transport system permease subunit
MHALETWQLAILLGLIGYVAVCFGLVARRNGLNPWLWGIVAVVSPLNLLALGYWAAVGRLPTRRS